KLHNLRLTSSLIIMHLTTYVSKTNYINTYTLSLHDALPILQHRQGLDVLQADPRAPQEADAHRPQHRPQHQGGDGLDAAVAVGVDRKSTRLNSSHVKISYAVFCLKKKK